MYALDLVVKKHENGAGPKRLSCRIIFVRKLKSPSVHNFITTKSLRVFEKKCIAKIHLHVVFCFLVFQVHKDVWDPTGNLFSDVPSCPNSG